MEINAGNILIILVGIVLCFFGIYLKRVTQIIMGFAWGAVICISAYQRTCSRWNA